ncbi:MAG: hypothetical protein ACK4JB_20050 [Reyranella sp.]
MADSDLTFEDFDRFLSAVKTGTIKCSICSNEQFEVNTLVKTGEESLQSPLATFEANSLPNTERAFFKLPYFTMCCDKCGNTYQFHRKMIEAWLAKNKAGGNV